MRIAIIAMIAAAGLAGCGTEGSDGDTETTTTRMNAVDVPKGTISDEVMPLDARTNPVEAQASDTAETKEKDAADQPTEAKDGASDSNTESESEE